MYKRQPEARSKIKSLIDRDKHRHQFDKERNQNLYQKQNRRKREEDDERPIKDIKVEIFEGPKIHKKKKQPKKE